jgi:glutaredoxin
MVTTRGASKTVTLLTLALLCLTACRGELSSEDRGLRRGVPLADAGTRPDAGRVVLGFAEDAGAPDAWSADAATPPTTDASTPRAPDAWSVPPPDAWSPPPPDAAAPPMGGTHAVTLYGASWCGSCAAARAFFMANGVAYTYRNAEDPAVQSEMLSRARMLGHPLDGTISLPVLVIDSTMTEGWSETRARGQLGL